MLRRLSVVLLCLALPASALADSFPVQRFNPGETPEDPFAVSRPADFGHMRWGLQLHADYANDPIVVEGLVNNQAEEVAAAVANMLTLTPAFSIGLVDRVVLFTSLPIYAVQETGDGDLLQGQPQGDGAGLGDFRLGGRFRIVGEAYDTFALAAQLTATVPTARLIAPSSNFSGENSLSAHPELLAEVRAGHFSLTLNTGVLIRQPQEQLQLDANQEITAGLGAAYRVLESKEFSLDATAQVLAATTVNNPLLRELTHAETHVGVRGTLGNGLVFGAAGGPGISRGYGSPDVRLIAMIGYSSPGDPCRTQSRLGCGQAEEGPEKRTEEPEPEVLINLDRNDPVGALALSVTDPYGQPMRKADVTLLFDGQPTEKRGTTDDRGRIAFESMEPSTYWEISVKVEGFDEVRKRISIVQGEITKVDMKLKVRLPQGQIRGVIQSFAGEPLQATVEVKSLTTKVTAEADGTFEIDVAPGQYEVVIRMKGYRPQRRTIKVEQDGVTIMNIDLRRQR